MKRKTRNDKIEFSPVPLRESCGPAINNVYVVVKNDRCKVLEALNSLEEDDKDEIRDLIEKLATIENFRSTKIKYKLVNYSYGEIKPKGHRVFFFKKCGDNFILFNYEPKKKGSLKSSIYKRLEREKDIYEKEFTKQFK